MFLDIRGSRTFHRVPNDPYRYLGTEQWTEIKSALGKGGIFDGVRALLICSPAPVVFLSGSVTDEFADRIQRLEDFKGHWSHRDHRAEQVGLAAKVDEPLTVRSSPRSQSDQTKPHHLLPPISIGPTTWRKGWTRQPIERKLRGTIVIRLATKNLRGFGWLVTCCRTDVIKGRPLPLIFSFRFAVTSLCPCLLGRFTRSARSTARPVPCRNSVADAAFQEFSFSLCVPS